MVSGLTFEDRKGALLITPTRMGPRRRSPVSRDRYRAIARGAGVRVPARPRWIDAALVGALAITPLIALPRAAAPARTRLDRSTSRREFERWCRADRRLAPGIHPRAAASAHRKGAVVRGAAGTQLADRAQRRGRYNDPARSERRIQHDARAQ